MDVKAKRFILIGILALMLLQLIMSVSAAPQKSSKSGSFAGSSDNVFLNALDRVLEFANLDFLGSDQDRLLGLLRIGIGIIVFSFIYWGFGALNNMGNLGGGNAVPRGIGITISIVVSIITVIFLPNELLILMGDSFALIFSLLFFGLVLAGIIGMWMVIPVGNHRAFWIVRALLVVAVVALFVVINEAAQRLVGG
ncbi:MAG TPA: hypothetical protein VJG49_04765 [Candidatus Nanoarchaeia archaeon]|nr:hypothetical protein [Candidatus Nanoarchaeia archaeon]